MRIMTLSILVAVMVMNFEMNLAKTTGVGTETSVKSKRQQPLLLGKLSKIGHVRQVQQPDHVEDIERRRMSHHLKARSEKNTHPSDRSLGMEFDEVEFMYDPEVNRKKLSNEEAEKRRNFETSLLLNKEKIKSTRGFQQINSIYKSLRRGDKIYGNGNINSIRFVPAVKILRGEKQSYLFNLSQLSSTETVLKCELYISKKHIRQRLLFDLHYFLSSSAASAMFMKSVNRQDMINASTITDSMVAHRQPSTQIDLGNLNLDKFSLLRTNNWHSFNIVDSLRPYAKARRAHIESDLKVTTSEAGTELLLVMESNQATVRSANNAKNNRMTNYLDPSNPYLMVYSKEQDKLMKQFFQNRIPKDLESIRNIVTENDGESNEERLSESEDISGAESNQKHPLENFPKTVVYPSENDKSIIVVEHVPVGFEPKLSQNNHSSSVISSLFYLPKLRMSRMAQEKNIGNNEGLVLLANESFWKHNLTEKVEDNCQTHPIDIDFDDIGFSSWILEPRRFGTNFCSGKCQFLPINKRTSLTNYAILQSILSVFDLAQQHPSRDLCCAPSKIQSMPILYEDESSNDFVVKLLPDMIVSECACR